MANFEVQGLKELKEILNTFPDKVKIAATRTGTRKAAARLRTYFRRAAPKRTGELRKILKSKTSRKHPISWVGLRTKFYYKRLEFDWGKTHAFMEKAAQSHAQEILDMMVDASYNAVFKEAGKAYIRSLAGRR